MSKDADEEVVNTAGTGCTGDVRHSDDYDLCGRCPITNWEKGKHKTSTDPKSVERKKKDHAR